MSNQKIFNIAVLIHGMIPDIEESNPTEVFRELWHNIAARNPTLQKEFPESHVIYVSWGHRIKDEQTPIRPDQKLTLAQQHISKLVRYDHVKEHPGPNDVVMSGLFGRDYGIPGLQGILTEMRETIVQFGLADVVYYCSAEGEKEVRRTVYGQVLHCLDNFKHEQEAEIRLHVIGHSLGVTITHDFLYGLFKQEHSPGFVNEDQGKKEDRERYLYWRQQAQDKRLTVGSFTSMASQLPLFVMRNHAMIDRFYDGARLNLKDIGIAQPPAANQGTIRWQIFYDIDDVLGFASRELYHDPHNLVRQIQVNTGFDQKAHTEYMKNNTVIRETARLIMANIA